MQKLMRMMHKNEKGFTLVELMVVVVIIGVLVAIAVPIYNAVQANAAQTACDANIRTIRGAQSMHLAETGEYADDLEDLDDYLDDPGDLFCPVHGDALTGNAAYNLNDMDVSCNGTGCDN